MFGYLLEGSGTDECGSEGPKGRSLNASLGLHTLPGAVLRETADPALKAVVNFNGSRPLFENVDRPDGQG